MAENMSSQKTEGKLKKLLSGKKGRRWIVLCVLAVAVIGGGTAFLSRTRAKAAKAETTYTTASVEKRSITNALTGSGTLQPADSYTVTTLGSGEVLSDTFEEGGIVEKDQLLYTIDSSDVSTTETQAQTNYTQALKAKYPTADISGTVSEVYVSNGDAVSAGTELCRISASNDLTIDFQFSYAKDVDYYVGQPAKIYINGYAGYIDGTVAQIGSSSVANGTGMKMTTVRVKAANPGLVSGDCTASAVVGNYTSYGQTTVKIGTGSTITATASGKVSGLTLMPGDSVSSGQRICTITGDSVDNQLKNAKASLESAQDRLDDYMVTSPITGTVVEKTVKALYSVEMLSEIDLAYAQTVHKAQGSEYRCVVLAAMPAAPGLMVRGVLYTALTRARELLVIVGDDAAIRSMAANDKRQKRYSGLKWRLCHAGDEVVQSE